MFLLFRIIIAAHLVVHLDVVVQVALFVLDEDGDGKITAIEFLKWWKSTDYSLIEAYI